MEINFDKKIYPKSAVLAAFSFYADLVYADISESEFYITVDVHFLVKDNTEKVLADIYQYLLQIATRHIIAEKTKIERELIIGRALYGSCLEETK